MGKRFTCGTLIAMGETKMKKDLRKKLWTALALVVLGGLFLSGRGVAGADQPAKAGQEKPGVIGLPAVGTYTLDPVHTFIFFNAQHKIVGKVRGRFNKMAGTFVVKKDPASCSVAVTIETSSVDTQNGIRDEDLRSPAFFDAAKYPTATYRGKGVRPSGDGWVMDGVLQIRDVKKVVPLNFKFNGTAPGEAGKPARVGFHAKTIPCKRADFKMTRDLLDEIGIVSSEPDVWIEIDTEALTEPKTK